MDIEKAIADQNYVLGEIKGGVNEVKELQRLANGRTGKLEDRVSSLEKTRNESTGIKKSWRELVGYFTGIGGIIIAIVALWFHR